MMLTIISPVAAEWGRWRPGVEKASHLCCYQSAHRTGYQFSILLGDIPACDLKTENCYESKIVTLNILILVNSMLN